MTSSATHNILPFIVLAAVATVREAGGPFTAAWVVTQPKSATARGPSIFHTDLHVRTAVPTQPVSNS